MTSVNNVRQMDKTDDQELENHAKKPSLVAQTKKLVKEASEKQEKTVQWTAEENTQWETTMFNQRKTLEAAAKPCNWVRVNDPNSDPQITQLIMAIFARNVVK